MQTTNNQQPQTTTIEASSTAAGVLARIEAEHMVPTPRYAFLVREWGIWALWGLSVVTGACAIAITLYSTLSAQYEMYEATHENFWTFMVAVLPFLWLGILFVMIAGAVVGMRQTKRGYRYSLQFIIGSSIACSLLGGFIFHCLGLGFFLDNVLGHQIGQYMSMEKNEQLMWQVPESGRLIGVVVPETFEEVEDESETKRFQFIDSAGKEWTIDTINISDREVMLLGTDATIRIVGTSTSETTFHMCGAFPSMYHQVMGWNEMRSERQEFVRKMVKEKMEMAREQASHGTLGVDGLVDELCARLRIVQFVR